MLCADMKERNSGGCLLLNMTRQTGLDLLHYLYNGRLREGSDMVGLLEVADKYHMPELKSWAAASLAAAVSEANFSPLLRLAELHDIPLLRAAVIRFIAGNASQLAA